MKRLAAALLTSTALAWPATAASLTTRADSAKAAVGTSGCGIYAFSGVNGFGCFDAAGANPGAVPIAPIEAPWALPLTGGTMSGPLGLSSTATGITDIHTSPPVNGVYLDPNGTYLDYCSVAGCLPGPHLLGQEVLFSKTHTDASAQETGLAINMTNVTGSAGYWGAGLTYAVGVQVHAGSGQDIYQVTVAGTSASSGTGPNFCPNPNPTTSPNPQCSNPATNSAGTAVSGGETNASTGTDGSVTWAFVGAGINDGKAGMSIGMVNGSGGGHAWAMDTSIGCNAVDSHKIGIPCFGYEDDTGNTTGYNFDIGGPIAFSVFINGYNTNRLTAAIGVFTGAPAATRAFNAGILFNGDQLILGDTIDDATSSNYVLRALAGHPHTAFLEDDSTSTTVLNVTGSHGTGINLENGTFGQAVVLAGSQFISLNSDNKGSFGYNGSTGRLIYGPAGTGSPVFAIDNNGNMLNFGHVSGFGGAPTLSSCGTSPSPSSGSNDNEGVITEGTTSTGCTATFASAYGNVPACQVFAYNNNGDPVLLFSASATNFTFTNASSSNQKYSYHCRGF